MERTKRRRSPTVLSLLCIALAHFDGRSAFYYCSKDLEKEERKKRGESTLTQQEAGEEAESAIRDKKNKPILCDRVKGWG